MVTATLKPGDRITEYVLEEKVGQGGFGEVWRARHNIWEDQQVAIKIPLHDGWVRRLQKEGVIQHGLEGDGIVRTLGLDPDHEPPYLILQWLGGGSLRDHLDREGRLPVDRSLEIAAETLKILQTAHDKGVTHRDIKPENILLDEEGKVFLTDFGLSRIVDDQASALIVSGGLLTKEGESLSGTIAYMSPEQKDPRRKVDHRTDLFSLGLVIFEMLTGSLPEGGEVPSDLNPEVTSEVDRIFRRCYARMEKRYTSAAEALKDIEGVRKMLPRGRPDIPPPRPAGPGEANLLSEKEAASFLRISLPEFRRRVADQQIPVVFVGDRAEFRLLDLAKVRRRIQSESLKQVPPIRAPYPTQYAGFFIRFCAFMVDCVILSVASTVIAPLGIMSPVVFAAYEVICHGTWGKTIGKSVLGIKVVPASGQQMNLGIAFVRMLGKCFSFATGLVGFIVAGFHPQKRSLHDLMADTWVVHR
jgi:serine/threonine protein kinase